MEAPSLTPEKDNLIQEATELLKIFSSILSKSGVNDPEVEYESFDDNFLRFDN